jgi:hypothetical protein
LYEGVARTSGEGNSVSQNVHTSGTAEGIGVSVGLVVLIGFLIYFQFTRTIGLILLGLLVIFVLGILVWSKCSPGEAQRNPG